MSRAFIDTSAFVAIFLKENDAAEIENRIISCSEAITSPVVLLETTLVLSSRKGTEIEATQNIILKYINFLNIKIIDINSEIGAEAIRTIPLYAKGYNNKAKLNFGDLLSYAAAKITNSALIYKGEDFIHTDLC